MERRPAQKFEDLIVWQKAHQLTLRVYKVTKTFPREELFGLTAQMRKAATSVPANIAEGFSKQGRSDKARFMNTAQGSLEELRYYFILGRDLGYIPSNLDWKDLDEVARLLGAYARTLRGSSPGFVAPRS
jgi:four helix bundle protein